jgi:hypothetical protein
VSPDVFGEDGGDLVVEVDVANRSGLCRSGDWFGARGVGESAVDNDGMSDVPWWGVPLIAGLFALGGVLLAQVNAIVMDRLRVRREDARRWHEDRRAVYARYLNAADTAVRQITSGRVIGDHRDDDEWRAAVAGVLGELGRVRTEIQLVASVAVYAAARELLVQTQALAARAETDLAERAQAEAVVADRRREFLTAARLELGVGV